MSLGEVVRIILRHWIIIALGLLSTISLTTVTYAMVPPTYASTSVVMLLQQSTDAVPGGQNPYLVIDGSLTVTAAAVERAATDSPETAAQLQGIDPTATFVITPVMGGPFLQVDSEASSSQAAVAVQEAVRVQMRKTLTHLQSSAGAPVKLQIRLSEVSEPTEPKLELKRKLQFVGGVFGAGLALTTSAAFLLDRFRGRRRREREARKAAYHLRQSDSIAATFGQPGMASVPSSGPTFAPTGPEFAAQATRHQPIRPSAANGQAPANETHAALPWLDPRAVGTPAPPNDPRLLRHPSGNTATSSPSASAPQGPPTPGEEPDAMTNYGPGFGEG